MKQKHLLLRIGLFILILLVGTGAALIAGETRSLALADLSDLSIGAVTQSARTEVLFAALSDETAGLYRSDDKGQSWQWVGEGPSAPVSALAAHPLYPRTLYAGTVDGPDFPENNLWYSEDGGRNWQATGLTLPERSGLQPTAVTALATLPDQPGVIYVGTKGQGLYRFYPGKGQQEAIGGTTLQNLYVEALVTSPDSRVYAVTTEGLLQLNGSQWQVINSLPDAAVSLAVDPTNPKILYAGTVAYGAYRSTDSGQSWEPINEGLGWQPGLILQVSAISIDPENPAHLSLATAYGVGSQWAPAGIYESFDAGRQWHQVAESQALVEKLVLEAGGIYAATQEGLIRYGEPLPPAARSLGQQFSSLANPSDIQLFILVLTVLVAIWILVDRFSWFPGERQASS